VTFRDVSVTDKIFHFSQCSCERWPSTLQTSYNPLLNFSLPTRGESCTVEGRGPKSVDFLMVLCQTLTSVHTPNWRATHCGFRWSQWLQQANICRECAGLRFICSLLGHHGFICSLRRCAADHLEPIAQYRIKNYQIDHL
jgi:hypothetical protein